MLRRLAVVLAVLVGLVLLAVAGGWLLITLEEPEPPEQLLDEEPSVDLAAYDGSDTAPEDATEAGEDATEVLVLGSTHLAQVDWEPDPDDVAAVTDALAGFEPDLVAVEHLPPDWPVGQGRDYRPELDVDAHAQRWGLDDDVMTAILDDPDAHDDPCEVGRAFLAERDLVNAAYWWDVHDCDEPTDHDELADWWDEHRQHETAVIGHPVAEDAGVERLASVDYQGDDAGWFLHEEILTREALTSPGDLWLMLPEVSPNARQLGAHVDQHGEDLVALLDHLNSPEWIGAQYWSYEQELAGIEAREAGPRQLDAYWRRNEEMAGKLDEAIADHDAQRALVIVGAGHKYFVDELAREAGHQWVDPREHLPDP